MKEKHLEKIRETFKSLSPKQMALFVEVSSDSSYGSFMLYDAFVNETLEKVENEMMEIGFTEQSIYNHRLIATRVIPAKLHLNLKANVFAIKDAIAVIVNKDGTPRKTSQAQELIELLKKPDTTQVQVRDVRKKYK